MDNLKIAYLISARKYLTSLKALRKKSFDLHFELSDFYQNMILNGDMMAFASFLNKYLVGATYVSCAESSIFIEELFVMPEYQNQGIGTSLINYVLANKELVEKHYQENFNQSRICPVDEKSYFLYKKLGYIDNKSLTGSMFKNI